ncbi:MAG: DAK2 domain-containing protein [Eubacterium sp.]|nr:DAK2 domain-containing protein [Eubacterium sp.]
MSTKTMDARLLAKMFLTGAQNLDEHKEWINELNVFPVPDGDTGSNMTMTIMSAANAVKELGPGTDMKSLGKAISSGSLRGARGNSGVILSQLCRGFTKVLKGTDEADIHMIADACEKAVETAYKAVMKPKEGTILTVAKGMADKARELADQADENLTLEDYLKAVLDYGNEVLAKTPEMLPVLKEAGVVDSGGQGLMAVIEGAYDGLTGRAEVKTAAPCDTEEEKKEKEEEKIKFLYAVEFIINPLKRPEESTVESFRKTLCGLGDTVVLIEDHGLLKVHVHTNEPGTAIQKAIEIGALTNILVENRKVEKHEEMLIQNAEQLALEQEQERTPMKEVGFITVCMGDGFEEIFKGLNVDYVISGGQTMNPSTEDVLNAVDHVHANNIFLFPNNKNVVMAAKQARELVREKNIIVIPTATVAQGITAMINYDPSMSVEDSQAQMEEEIGQVKTAEITYAVRDTSIDGVPVHKDDIMAVGDKGLLSVGKEVKATSMEAIKKMVGDDSSLISIYYGADFSEEEAETLGNEVMEVYPDCDVEVSRGGQPIYYCIISVE